MKIAKEEEYEFSECSEKVFKTYYPDSLTPSNPTFQHQMYETQRALIECKIPIMFKPQREQALKTLRFIREEMKCKR